MLKPKLLLIMQRELDSSGLELSANGKQQVEQLVTYGLDRMRRSHALEHPGLIINAEQNLKSLVKYLADYARETGTFPNLGAQDFDSAMRVCPTLWPYCTSG